MKVEVKIPEVGEAVREAVLAQWYKQDGDRVAVDEILFVIETDKVTLEVSAQVGGVLRIKVPEGQTVAVGTVVALIETDADLAPGDAEASVEKGEGWKMAAEGEGFLEAGPVESVRPEVETVRPERVKTSRPEAAGAEETEGPAVVAQPSARRLAAEIGVDVSKIQGTGPGGWVTRGDVLDHREKAAGAAAVAGEAPAEREAPTEREAARPARKVEAVYPPPAEERVPSAVAARGEAGGVSATGRPGGAALAGEERMVRKPMSPIRRRIAERLLEAKQKTAMLTTFNEIDMSRVQAVRAKFKESFRAKHGVSLGIMSFFIKASVEALKEYPEVNALIDGKDLVYHEYYHIGVAVGAERGLVVPVIRHADRLGFADLERAIADYVKKIGENRLELSDLEGGTFTISNGGIYGSLLSTPILNMPQSGILGMHKIEERPVVIDGQVAVRPMMYVAFSYDHRIIDGREAVGFLKRIKECIENPERIMLQI